MYSLRTIAAKAAHYDWYNRARNYDSFCFEQSRSVEIDLYKANKDIYFRIRNDVNAKLTNLLRQFSEEFLDENLASGQSPEIFKKLKYYQQVFKTINQLNRTIDFDRYPKADLPEMLGWKSTSDKGTFNKQPDSNPEEYLEKLALDETMDCSAFTNEIQNHLEQSSTPLPTEENVTPSKLLTEEEIFAMTPPQIIDKIQEIFEEMASHIQIE